MHHRSEPAATRRRAIIGSLFAAVVVIAAAIVPAQTAAAAPTAYYVNNLTGSTCSNTGPGTAASPYCDFSPIDGSVLSPGDSVKMACGATWTQSSTETATAFVRFGGTGTASAPIVIDAYDPGNVSSNVCVQRPHLIGNARSTSVVLWIDNPSYFTVQNLELSDGAVGLRAYTTSPGKTKVTINNLYVHDFKGTFRGSCTTFPNVYTAGGILVDNPASAAPASPTSLLTNVVISNVEGTRNQNSIAMSGYGCIGEGPGTDYYYQNVELKNLYLHGDNGPAAGCSDGLQLVAVRNVQLRDSVLDGEAGCYTNSGTAAIFLAAVKNVDIFNNLIKNTPYTGSPDESGIDYEGFNDDVDTYNNHFSGHAGPGVEILSIHGSGDYSTGSDVANNTFENNGKNKPSGSVERVGNDITATGSISGNLYREKNGFTTSKAGGTFSGFALTNNVSSFVLTNAANDFSSTAGRWSYEYTTNGGTTWSAMTYNPSTSRWEVPGTLYESIGQFGVHPGDCSNCQAARTYTAPVAGIVSLRGRAAKQDAGGGNGVGVTVTKNGTAVVARQVLGATDKIGIDTNADNVSVVAGDKIRFVVDSNGSYSFDSTSWVPAVGYSGAVACGSSVVQNCSFETPSTSTYVLNPTGTGVAWTFTGFGGVSANSSAYTSGTANAPFGSRVAFLQGTAAMTQTVTTGAGALSIAFSAAQRNCCSPGLGDFAVYVDSTLVGTFTPSGTTYKVDVTAPVTVTAGTHVIKFVGLNSAGGDHTVFIDNVTLY